MWLTKSYPHQFGSIISHHPTALWPGKQAKETDVMDTITTVMLFSIFCLMLAFLAVFARPQTAKIVVKALCDVIDRLLKHYLP